MDSKVKTRFLYWTIVVAIANVCGPSASAGSMVIDSGIFLSVGLVGEKVIYAHSSGGTASILRSFDGVTRARRDISQISSDKCGTQVRLFSAHGGTYAVSSEPEKQVRWTDGESLYIVAFSPEGTGCTPDVFVGTDGSVWIGPDSASQDLSQIVYRVASPVAPVVSMVLPISGRFNGFKHASDKYVVYETVSQSNPNSNVRLCVLERATGEVKCKEYVDFVAELPDKLLIRHYIIGGGNLYAWNVATDAVLLVSGSGSAYESRAVTLGDVALLRMDTYASPIDFALWTSGGESQSTSMVHTLCPSDCGNYFYPIKLTNAQAVLVVSRGSDVKALWRTDGTPAGTFPVAAIPSSPPYLDPQGFGGWVLRESDGSVSVSDWSPSRTGIVRWIRWRFGSDGTLATQGVVVERESRQGDNGVECEESILAVGMLEGTPLSVFGNAWTCDADGGFELRIEDPDLLLADGVE